MSNLWLTLKDSVTMAEFKYPYERIHSCLFSTKVAAIRLYADDALNVSRMNMQPGGKQPRTRDTVWAGQVQKLVNDKDVLLKE